MTRINVVPPLILCDEHLLCELREILRIPRDLEKLSDKGKQPVLSAPGSTYVLGEGHVRFFYDKVRYLEHRYQALLLEAQARGFHATDEWPHHLEWPERLYNSYVPTKEAILLNLMRITQKFQYKFRPTFSPRLK